MKQLGNKVVDILIFMKHLTDYVSSLVVLVTAKSTMNILARRQRPVLTLPLGAKFDPQGLSWPPGVKLSPRGEDPLFASSFF
jgi:hypothetical protein